MSTEQNKAIVARLWEEVWHQGKIAVCDEIFVPAYADHEKQFRAYVQQALADLQVTIEDMIAEGDKVVTRYTFSGTHQGDFLGIPASGKPFTVTGIWIHRLADGRIIEGQRWGAWDALSFLKQVGYLP
jgi:steroid delta-isomerase-like uncharacterized protein